MGTQYLDRCRQVGLIPLIPNRSIHAETLLGKRKTARHSVREGFIDGCAAVRNGAFQGSMLLNIEVCTWSTYLPTYLPIYLPTVRCEKLGRPGRKIKKFLYCHYCRKRNRTSACRTVIVLTRKESLGQLLLSARQTDDWMIG